MSIPTPTEIGLAFPQIDPVMIDLFGLKVHWYGIAYIAGIVLGIAWVKHVLNDLKDFAVKKDHLDSIFTYLIIGIILGGRLGYVLFYCTVFIW